MSVHMHQLTRRVLKRMLYQTSTSSTQSRPSQRAQLRFIAEIMLHLQELEETSNVKCPKQAWLFSEKIQNKI